MKAILLYADGKTSDINVTGGYKQLQQCVGGLIDAVTNHDEGISGYVNDEGLLIGLPLNPIASILFGRYLVGDVVVCGAVDDDGNDTDVPEIAERIISMHQTVMAMHNDFIRESVG